MVTFNLELFLDYRCFAPSLLLSTKCFPPDGSTALVGLGLLCEVPRSHSDTPQSVGLLVTSDRPVEETSTCLHTALTRDRHQCLRRDSNLQSQQAIGRRPAP